MFPWFLFLSPKAPIQARCKMQNRILKSSMIGNVAHLILNLAESGRRSVQIEILCWAWSLECWWLATGDGPDDWLMVWFEDYRHPSRRAKGGRDADAIAAVTYVPDKE